MLKFLDLMEFFYAVKDNKLFIYTFDSKALGHIFTNELNIDEIISYKFWEGPFVNL